MLLTSDERNVVQNQSDLIKIGVWLFMILTSDERNIVQNQSY